MLKHIAAFAVSLTLSLNAHEVPTHRALSKAAVEFLEKTLDTPEQQPLRECLPAILNIILEGTGREDEDPGNRFLFHFNPRLNSPIQGFARPINRDRIHAEASCNSSEWAFSEDGGPLHRSKPCWHNMRGDFGFARPITDNDSTLVDGLRVWRQNDHTWHAAKAAGRSVLKKSRQAGWWHLGYVIHLLQDLTSPAHVRNDAHGWKGDPDPLEEVSLRYPLSFPTTTDFADLVFRDLSAEDLFETAKQWTQSRFFSRNRLFNSEDGEGRLLPGPEPRMPIDRSSRYVYDLEGNPIARITSAGTLFSVDAHILRFTQIDETVANAQWKRIGPQAVLYTAYLIYKFWLETGRASPCEGNVCLEFQGRITEAGNARHLAPPLSVLKKDDPVVARITFNPLVTPSVFTLLWSETVNFPLRYSANSTVLYFPFGAYVPSELPGIHMLHASWTLMQYPTQSPPSITYNIVSDLLVPKGKEEDADAYRSYLTGFGAKLEMTDATRYLELLKTPIPPFNLRLFSTKSFSVGTNPGLNISGELSAIGECPVQ